ncbi:hypothetical protein [Bacillus cereus]|uniref:hypothetical protein n=1 Tax=Bacillus cereus TaxID=1396 RepID=UPI0018F41773|nr:hypothetical protein [Bacillus cereus]MBJ7987333.1 hypothetical protein [Bacillus cereus]
MYKKILTFGIAATIGSTAFIPFSEVKAAENNITQKVRTEIISDDKKETHPIPDGGYNWHYVDTRYGNNVTYNTVDQILQQALVAGFAGSLTNMIPISFIKGVANLFAGKVILEIPRGQNIWFKVEKYWDVDAYNSYIKYKVWIWSDSGRTKLIKYYEQVQQS